MSERSVFSPSGILARTLAFAARKSPKGLNVIFAAGYGVCEVLGAQVLLSTLWPIFQSQLKERLHASTPTGNNKQSVTPRATQVTQSSVPLHNARVDSRTSGSTLSASDVK